MDENDHLIDFFAGKSEAERRQKVAALSDESLLRYHASLHASLLIQDTLWIPLIEAEMARRGILSKS